MQRNRTSSNIELCMLQLTTKRSSLNIYICLRRIWSRFVKRHGTLVETESMSMILEVCKFMGTLS
jgi:hypothetical protein